MRQGNEMKKQVNWMNKWARGMRKDLFYYYSNDKIKIIGNIYENTELLEQGRETRYNQEY